MSRGLLRKLLVTCLALMLCAAVQAAAPAAGVVIRNTAIATFVDTATGLASRLNSNTVSTRVTELEAVTLVANQNLLLATGAPFAISHTLTNTGNTDSVFRIDAATAAGTAFTPLNLQVVQDSNGNGRADAGEPVVPAAGISVAAGAGVNLLLTGQVPSTATPGQVGRLVLTATSAAQGARASNTDTLTLTSGAAVQVVLSASAASATPAAPLVWTAVAVNNGSIAAAPLPVTVDGANAIVFVLRVPVPVNTSFASAMLSSNVGAQTLYHVAGAAANVYVTALPPRDSIDAVAWALTSLPPGGSLQGQLRVDVHANADGIVTDTAYADWSDQAAMLLATSNTVNLPLPPRSAQIAFYTGSTYLTPAVQNTAGKPLYVQADAARCNADPTRVDSVPVTVTSQLTGDSETFTGVETGPNTGIFRILPDVPTANGAVHVIAAGDGILEVLRNDLVSASIAGCAGTAAMTTLLIDPSGIVYDSRSNLPLAGATVELVDVTGAGNGGRPGEAAAVVEDDGVTKAPSQVVTGADGVYAFPLVQPSTYRLRVTPPAGFVFPSTLPAALQPAGRLIDTPGSYGGSFTLALGPVRFDVPLDTGGNSGLFVRKSASKSAAELGDFVDYTVKVHNVLSVPLPRVEVRDTLPAGFAYVRGSARLNGAALADPAGGSGPGLLFALGSVAAGAEPALTYRVRIGPGSQGGTGVNSARAASGNVGSNQASVKVQVLGGVFSDAAYVIGKVYADCNRDGVQQAGEPGIPGVRIYLEDGTYAVTDVEGKYSFYGLAPRTHVAKVDRTTLPAGVALQVLDHRNAQDAGSRFVDLTNGELRKADFAVGDCGPGLTEQIEARRKALANPSEMAQAASQLLPATGQAATTTDARTLPASGALGLPGAARTATGSSAPVLASADGSVPALGAVGDTGGPQGPNLQGLPRPIYTPAATLLTKNTPAAEGAMAVADPAMAAPLEDLLPQLSAETAFVGLRDGQVLPVPQTRVRVKGPLGGVFELTVNGAPVPVTKVGKRSSLEQKQLTAWEYIGVDLRPGRNTLAVQVKDPFGNVRGSAQITLLAPGTLATVRIATPEQPVADGATPVAVNVALQDENGLPMTARTLLTLQSSAGEWQVADADPRQPGTQVLVEGGTGRFLLMPPAQPGKAEVTVLAGTVKAAATIEFMPNLRPLLAAGIVEGTLNLRNLSASALQPAQGSDVFERQIRTASASLAGGKGDAAARAALFLKGKVLGSALLTLAYDSDKPGQTALFRDIQPNQFYPVYGDSSARGFDGQSTGRLYVLLQQGSSYALLGDFSTQTDNPARQLTQYSRSLNGAKGRWSDGKASVEAFASRTSASQVVQEYRANGTSGPFRLNLNGVVNSEQVHVITRSRSQPTLVLEDKALAAYTDYALEAATGMLLLKEPVPSVDAELNPIFIRVSYDVDSGGPRHDVAGVEATLQVAPGITVGAVAVQDQDPANRQKLAGVTLTARPAEKTVITAELAHSSTDQAGSGNAQRVELRHEAAGVDAHVWGVRTDTGFANTGSPQTGGQAQYGAKVGYALDESNRIVGEALKTSNAATGASQVGVELKLEHTFAGNVRLEAGVRHSSANAQSALSSVAAPGTAVPGGDVTTTAATAGSGDVEYTSARLKLTVPVPGLAQADVYGLVEQAVDGSGGREIGIGANYAVNPTTRIYARHDFINSLGSATTLDTAVSRYTTVAGVTTALPDNTQVFNEYRVGDGVDGRSAEAAVGLKKSMQLFSGFGVSAGVQRIKPLSGPTGDDSTAVALGADYTGSKDWKASAQLQWQESATSRSWYASAAVVNKLGPDWTLLNRYLYSIQRNSGASGGEHELASAQAGVAFRPVDSDKWNALGRLEYRRERDTTTASGIDQDAWIFSTHVNYQASAGWVMSGRYAAKRANDSANGISSSSLTQLVGGRSTWDLAERWDTGVQGYRLWGNGAAESALGLELGYLAWKNLWLSAGYNMKGFAAADLAGDAHTQQGAYLRLRFKFDEGLLEQAGAGR